MPINESTGYDYSNDFLTRVPTKAELERAESVEQGYWVEQVRKAYETQSGLGDSASPKIKGSAEKAPGVYVTDSISRRVEYDEHEGIKPQMLASHGLTTEEINEAMAEQTSGGLVLKQPAKSSSGSKSGTKQDSTTTKSDSDSGTETDSDMAISRTKNGIPKSQYSYTGNDTQAFQQWRNLEISTDEFAFQTSPGQGTASLVPPSERQVNKQQRRQQKATGAPSTGAVGGGIAMDTETLMLGVAALAAVAVAMGGIGGN